MDNLELLSDDDLRRRLLEFGFPNLPVTQTTRKILIKKLRNHLAATNSNLRKSASLATRYSSGEDSDTISAESVKSRRTRISVSGSPSGRNVVDHQMPPPSSFTSPRSGVYSSGGKKSSVYVSPVIINDSEDDDVDWSLKKSPRTPRNASSTRSRSSDLYSSLDSSQRNVNGNSSYDQEDIDDPNTTSEYTKRLLQFREGNLQRQNSNLRKRTTYAGQRSSDYPSVNENDIVYHAEPSLEPAHIPLNTAIKNFINRLDAAYGFKQTFVPMVLVAFLIIFFLLIIFVYVTIHPNIENILNEKNTLHVPCDNINEMDASFTCIDERSLESSLNLLKVLAPELQARAVASRCDKSSSKSNIMCVKEVWQFLSENQPNNRYSGHGLDLIKDLHNVEYLVDRNKQWGIQNVNTNGEPISLNNVLEMRAHQTECFAILKPKLPLACTIYNKLQTFFFIIGTLGTISFVVFILRKFYQFVLQIKEKRRAQIDMIIREICSTLMEKAMIDRENCAVVVNHLRDKIIEPSKRSELSWAWHEAITYLEQNDSRVHFGVETINGEDFKVIRWIEDIKNSSFAGSQMLIQQQQQQQLQQQQQRLSNNRYPQQAEGRQYLKKWVGSAFDRSNKIKDPPTNCLKIRQMFDKFEANSPNLQTIIQDTILHKVRDKNCKIYDIQLDLKSCCVYVKCASCADAGILHESINGWWLDTGLVVVKFLKLDKYHQRFPTSLTANTPMHPSSNVYVTQTDSATNGIDYFDEDVDDDDFE